MVEKTNKQINKKQQYAGNTGYTLIFYENIAENKANEHKKGGLCKWRKAGEKEQGASKDRRMAVEEKAAHSSSEGSRCLLVPLWCV